jgi:DNA-binding MarR family transcriptional regulator
VADRSSKERHRRVAAALSGLHDLRRELALLNHRVGIRVQLKNLDLDCLAVIARHGPITPTALASRIGVHLATMTGILKRLEAGQWVTRTPVAADRRATVITSAPNRQREFYCAFEAMNRRMGGVCGCYTDEQLDVIVDFLHRAAAAAHTSAVEMDGSLAP